VEGILARQQSLLEDIDQEATIETDLMLHLAPTTLGIINQKEELKLPQTQAHSRGTIVSIDPLPFQVMRVQQGLLLKETSVEVLVSGT
jgi:hypothetical protein